MPAPVPPAKSRPLLWASISAVVLLCAAALLALFLEPRNIPLKTGVLLPHPRPVVDFTLQGAEGTPVTRSDLRGHWTLVFSGYTHCPDVCPTTLAALAQVFQKLGDFRQQLHMLFISVDPKRDTPQLLARYVHAFNPGFAAATGSEQQLKKLGRNLGFAFSYAPSTDGNPNDYLVNHSAVILLINPEAQLAGFFSPPIKIKAMATDLRHVIAGTAVDPAPTQP